MKAKNKSKPPAPAKKPVPDLLRTPEQIPIIDINQYDAFVDAQGGIVDLLEIPCKDINASKEYDVIFDMYNWTWLLKSYADDLKIVSMHYPAEVSEQIKYLQSHLEKQQNPIFKKEIEKEIASLEATHETYFAREFYLMFFSSDETEYRHNMNRIQSHLGNLGQAQKMSLGKKLQVISKMLNMNAPLKELMDTREIPRGIAEGKGYNPQLLAAIQPRGGVSFRDERVIKKGDGYEACVHVYDYPASVNFSWLLRVIDEENTIVTVDIGSEDRLKTISDISKSIEEQASRFEQARYHADRFDARRIYAQLETLHEDIVSVGEVVKRVHIRIFTFATTMETLEENISKLITGLESKNFKGAVFLDENAFEWRSLLLSLRQQDYLPNRRHGASIPSETVALGHPYHASALSDPFGSRYGHTKTRGVVIFDPYCKNKGRMSYSTIVLGLPRSGKSTFLKHRMKKDVIQGNFIRGFATNKEFDRIVSWLGGSVINLDGSDGFLNVLHVYKTAETESASFLRHIEKVVQYYCYMVPEADTYDISVLAEILRQLYEKHMGYDVAKSDAKITGREPEEYPIISDLLSFLQNQMYCLDKNNVQRKREEVADFKFGCMQKIETVLIEWVKSKGHILNGHSSIRDFSKEKVVFFNVAGLMQLSPRLFDAQVYSGMSLFWDNLIEIGTPQKEAFDDGLLKVEDAKKFIVMMDEAHNFVNANKISSVQYLDRFSRECPKYFGGIILATHKITDFIPTDSMVQGVDAMHNLFSLAQYKFLFKQSEDTEAAIRNAFGSELSQKHIESLMKKVAGQCILSIAGAETIEMTLEVDDDELELYRGGA